MWGGSQGRVSCGVMEKLGKLGVVSFKLPGFRGHLHWGLPQLYLPGLLTSLSLHPPLPLASKETTPPPPPPTGGGGNVAGCCLRPCCLAWSFGMHVRCTGFRSPWGPCAGAMSPHSLCPQPLWPCLVPRTSHSRFVSMASCPRDACAPLPFWTVYIVLYSELRGWAVMSRGG